MLLNTDKGRLLEATLALQLEGEADLVTSLVEVLAYYYYYYFYHYYY